MCRVVTWRTKWNLGLYLYHMDSPSPATRRLCSWRKLCKRTSSLWNIDSRIDWTKSSRPWRHLFTTLLSPYSPRSFGFGRTRMRTGDPLSKTPPTVNIFSLKEFCVSVKQSNCSANFCTKPVGDLAQNCPHQLHVQCYFSSGITRYKGARMRDGAVAGTKIHERFRI